MKRHQKEIIKLTAKEVLFSVFDLALPFFQSHRLYRIPANKLKRELDDERSVFLEKIRYLKKQGLIENFVEGKDKYIEITPKGIQKLDQIRSDNIVIERSKCWDSKWWVVIFDIPKKHSKERDAFRSKLIQLGFQRIQDSVYVFPFNCSEVIEILSNQLSISNFVLVMVSEIIQGEQDIINKFLTSGILKETDLKKNLNL